MTLSEAIREFLILDETLVNMLPEQTGLDGITAPPQNKQASIFRRKAHQQAVHPFVIVGLPHDFDDGSHSDGNLPTKIDCFPILVAGDLSAGELEPIEKRIRKLLFGDIETSGIRQSYLPTVDTDGKVWVQSLLLLDRQFVDAQNVEGGEQGLPSWVLMVKAAYVEPAA